MKDHRHAVAERLHDHAVPGMADDEAGPVQHRAVRDEALHPRVRRDGAEFVA
jgi:hypothetical protein